MISINYKTSNSIVICIDKLKKIEMMQIMNQVLGGYSQFGIFAIQLCGIDTDRFIDGLNNQSYLLVEDKSHRFIKDLPRLYYLSENYDDVKLFFEYCGCFNEGYMILDVLLSEKCIDQAVLCNEKETLECIRMNSVLTISVTDDGDALELYSDYVDQLKSIYDIIVTSIT